jgi:hypothetical protein
VSRSIKPNGAPTVVASQAFSALGESTQCRSTDAGHHVNHGTPFPFWAGADSVKAAKTLSEAEALSIPGTWAQTANLTRS